MSLATMNTRTNIAALSTRNNLALSEGGLLTSMGRLSSGLRINMASDDAAGLSISEKLRAQVRGLDQARRNANDGVSLLQTAEGALGQLGDMLIRMRELAIQSANGTMGVSERTSIQTEFSALKSEIDRIANVTEFNGQKLVDGSLSAGVTFQVGIENVAANDRITVSLGGAHATTIGISSAVSLSTVTGARNALEVLDTAIQKIADLRGDIGAAQNRLRTTINNLAAAHQNLTAANSRIRDTDVAKEAANMARQQVMMRAGISVLAQANQLPSLAMSLLQQ